MHGGSLERQMVVQAGGSAVILLLYAVLGAALACLIYVWWPFIVAKFIGLPALRLASFAVLHLPKKPAIMVMGFSQWMLRLASRISMEGR